MYRRLLQNHVLANIAFVLVVLAGITAYKNLPRQQDPTINFNWIQVTTFFPGASAEDVEKRITDPIEDAIRKIDDIRFVNSSSLESLSSILIRFEEIDEHTFDKRVADLRREIQSKERELPDDIEPPTILEITTDNGFPTAQIVVSAVTRDENLRVQARNIRKDLELIEGVSRVDAHGFNRPELHIEFIPELLQSSGLTPTMVADAIRASYRDVAAGNTDINQSSWLIRLTGITSDPAVLASLPILSPYGEIRLGSVAKVSRGEEEADQLVSYNGQPAILMSVMKAKNKNTLKLVDKLQGYIQQRNRFHETTGVSVELADDQTEVTRNALNVMQANALLGLSLVMLIAWAFLGFRIALFTSIAIPFVLFGTFWVLQSIGQTLNVVVLLGIVISLGMLIDDAVVVVEAIYYRLQRGQEVVSACIESVQEIFAPVTTAVLTTMAAFLPLMLMPGIVGKFMFVVPFVVTVALALSLIEAYWMLPAHIIAGNVKPNNEARWQKLRIKALHRIRLVYTRLLIRAMRYPRRIIASSVAAFVLAIATIPLGLVNFDFFASDPLRIFYVNVRMPAGTTLEESLNKTVEVEKQVATTIEEHELRAIVSYSGLMFTETEPFFGDRYAQIMISLQRARSGMRDVGEIIEVARESVKSIHGAEEISFMRISGGPPVTKPITIKVRGDSFAEIRAAASDLATTMATVPGVKDISIDDTPGQNELLTELNYRAIQDAGLQTADIHRILRLYIDGEILATTQHEGEELNLRIRASQTEFTSLDHLLQQPVPLAGGGSIPLGQLVYSKSGTGFSRIRHYNYRRSIEVSADLDKDIMDEVSANKAILSTWNEKTAIHHPNVDLDTSGILDDIFESLSALQRLLMLGVLLIYLILGTQFRSYFQPLLILSTVPLAFTGVILGMLINRNPISLFTLYGVVALAGIAVNSAIVLISAANSRLEAGMSVLHATLYAARRRVIPIIITSLTTIAGLFSLAVGLGGYSLLWGPMASSIVWGLSFSTLLTLFVIPVLYEYFMRLGEKTRQNGGLIALFTKILGKLRNRG